MAQPVASDPGFPAYSARSQISPYAGPDTGPEAGPEDAGISANGNSISLPPVALLLAALFSYALVSLAFVLRPLIEWADLFRYVQRFSIDPYYGMALPQRLIDYPLSEYGWQLIVLAIFESGLAFEASFAAISMLSLAMMAYTLLRHTGRPLTLLLFVNPAMIDFSISQVRSALALAIVFITLTRSLPLALAGIALASTIHTSMLLFALPLLVNFIRERFAARQDGAVAHSAQSWALLAFGIAVVLAGFQILILDFLGDRRAGYALADLSTGVLLTTAWSVIGLAGFALARVRTGLPLITVMFLLGMFVTSSILGLYSHRYAAFLVPFLGLALAHQAMPRDRLVTFMGLYGAFSLIYFSYWL